MSATEMRLVEALKALIAASERGAVGTLDPVWEKAREALTTVAQTGGAS